MRGFAPREMKIERRVSLVTRHSSLVTLFSREMLHDQNGETYVCESCGMEVRVTKSGGGTLGLLRQTDEREEGLTLRTWASTEALNKRKERKQHWTSRRSRKSFD